MQEPTIVPEKIISRLKFFGYKYEADGNTLRIMLPMLCYLKIEFKKEQLKMTSHVRIAFNSIPLEYNFLIYGFGLFIFTWYCWGNSNKALFLLLGLFIIYFIDLITKSPKL